MSNITEVDSENSRLISGNVHEEFKEAGEVAGIIDSLLNIYKNQIAVEMATERFLFITDQYQEQPHLLDPHLEKLINQLLDLARKNETPEPVMHLAFRFLYLITKTRGYKVIVRLLPHEVADVEPVLAMLAKQSPDNHQAWETRYMLLLWLSMVCMIPFDMVKLDSNARQATGETRAPIMQRIIDAGQRYLAVSDKSRDAAAYMLARFMTRPDVKRQRLPEFLDSCLVRLKAINMQTLVGMTEGHGILSTLALLYKHGKREDLLPYAPTILGLVFELKLADSTNTLLRKLCTKLTQRIGLAFLKAKVATWRYQRGSRCLAANLTNSSAAGTQNEAHGTGQEEEDEYDIPSEIEDVIESLLSGLRDKDTVVRWSAAKGLGRLTSRLPRELADDVVGSLMELFSLSETDGAWHGACLAMAELGRRGLLLPDRLPEVVPVMMKALRYDEKRGHCSVGAHVRDAACYVMWAFARAYEAKDIAPHVNEIAAALILVSVFDREINVRRAAAAAFQEHVGRQGQFPHGIDILTTCDYFAVGNRVACYLELSVYVAQWPEYTTVLIDHLVQMKIGHWDGSIRELTAQALNRLTSRAPVYMAETVLPQLLEKSDNIDVNLRHGAILAFAEIVQALAVIQAEKQQPVSAMLKPDIIEGVKLVAPKLQKAQLFKGYGGELMRKAVCSLIDKLSASHMPYHGDPVIALWQEHIDDCLEHVELEVQMAAVTAIPAFFSEYYKQPDSSCDPRIQDSVLSRYLSALTDSSETLRIGFARALGALPAFALAGRLGDVLDRLMVLARGGHTERGIMAEAHRDAVSAITSICGTVGVKQGGRADREICEHNLDQVYDTFFDALRDYTLDSRGDVGAWVREAAMTGLLEFSSHVIKQAPALFKPDTSRAMMCVLVQQAVEKIDRTRAHAGHVFSSLLYHTPPIPNVPCLEKLVTLFPQEECNDLNLMNWASPASTFPRFTKLLHERMYTYHVLLGMTVSVGGLTESLVKHSSYSLLGYLREIKNNKEEMTSFIDVLLRVFRDNQKVDRVTLPMFKMLDQLLTNNIFHCVVSDPASTFVTELYELCKAEVSKCGDVQKLLASIDVFCGLLEYEGETRKKLLYTLCIFMCHKFPIVRRNSAGKLYETLMVCEDLVAEESLEEANSLLSETQWDEPIAEVKPIRNRLCELFGISPPVTVKK